MSRTASYERIDPNDLRKCAKKAGISELIIIPDKNNTSSSEVPIENAVFCTKGEDAHKHKFSACSTGDVRIRTSLKDAFEAVEERRCTTDPLYEILQGDISACNRYIQILKQNADKMDVSGKLAEAISCACSTGDDLLTRITVVHCIMLRYIDLESIGLLSVAIEDGVVIKTNGVCPQGFSALHNFIMNENHGDKWLTGAEEYASDHTPSTYFSRLAMAYITARSPWNTPFSTCSRRSTE